MFHYYDKYLFLYLLLICSVKLIVLFLWTYLDTLRPKISQEYVSLAIPPHYQVSIECNSQNQVFWLLATSLYSGILIIFVVFMATQTRHIKKAHFEDTKKVNLFIFLVTIILSTTLPLWVIFGAICVEIGAHEIVCALSDWRIFLWLCCVNRACSLPNCCHWL